MIGAVFGRDEIVATWAAERIKYVNSAADFFPGATIGWADETGALVCAVIYHGFRPNLRSIEMSIASEGKRWCSRTVITTCLRYPFVTLGVRRITSYTPRRNKAAISFIRRLGFKGEGIMRQGCGNDDLVISGFLKKDWDASPFNLERVHKEMELA